MGGRGQNFELKGTRKSIINNLVIPRDKIKNYLLNASKDNDKSNYFKNLGYSYKDWKRFRFDIIKGMDTKLKSNSKDLKKLELYQMIVQNIQLL